MKTTRARWRRLRVGRMLLVALIGGFIPAGRLVDMSGLEQHTTLFALSWFAGLIVVFFYLVFFRCPNCGDQFHVGTYSNPFARRCMHCKIRPPSLLAMLRRKPSEDAK